jgi:hypothetical protein
MSTGRLEAFSDGVLAIIITVMVLELHVPENDHLSDLWRDTGVGLLTYLLSFVYIGIYWNNHHHMFQIVDYVDGSVLWANLHLLFWLSLYPFTTAWLDESKVALTPTVLLDALLHARRDHRSSPVDSDDCDPFPAGLLDDLVRDPHEGAANVLAVEYDLLAQLPVLPGLSGPG